MIDRGTIVLDVGKTNTKVSLWDRRGDLLAEHVYANRPRDAAQYRALDVSGIDAWLLPALADCARQAEVTRIVPVGHGAAAAILKDDRLWVEPMDYEQAAGEAERRQYASERDDFRLTGSPLLPGALNLGMQLHLVESLSGRLPHDATVLPWPQYWAWRLCGVKASEVTSLGCHSDLWRPNARVFSDLARRRGWAQRMAPLRRADAVLATVRPSFAAATGLPSTCEVLCGVHDSNAALLGMRGHGEMADNDATVLSTGTWFVAMRSLSDTASFDTGVLDESRDCLVNVDVEGRIVPSARFMGGREAERIRGPEIVSSDARERPDALLGRLPGLLSRGVQAYPSFVPGVGPYPDSIGRLEPPTDDSRDRRIIASVYLALMSDAALDLIGSRDRLVVEGPFADDPLFVRSLASLRLPQAVFTCNGRHDLAYGALRLAAPDLPPPSELTPVTPLEIDLKRFADDWRRHVDAGLRPSARLDPMDSMRVGP